MQKVNFDGQEGVSQPDVDSEDTEVEEWKLFRATYLYTIQRKLNI